LKPNQRDLFEFIKSGEKFKVLVVEDRKAGNYAGAVLSFFKRPFLKFPDLRAEKFDDLSSYREELFQIFSNLDQLYFSGKDYISIIPQATFQHPFPSQELRKSITIEFAENLDLNSLEETLKRFGFVDNGVVLNRGEFSIHQKSFDIFPINSENPFRISFSKDFEIEQISKFSQFNQLKIGEEFEKIEIYPAFFNISKEREEEILEDIEFSHFNSPFQTVSSFGLWFLKDNEVARFKSSDVKIYHELPRAKSLYKEELDQFVETQNEISQTDIILDELSVGDYIVHREYGIGVFETLTKEYVLGGLRDFVKIKYFGENHLLLPIEKLGLISRYISGTGKTPQIDKLGKGGFYKRSSKVQNKINEIAKYIVETSAQRKMISAPQIDKIDLKELQNSAGFQYTEDQKDAVSQIMIEISEGYPSDQLLIGDVGFGKTEVAINIIYSVVKSGFQVAFVVPTTILAKQHFITLSSRLKSFNIKIAHIDSFITAKGKREISKGLKEGETDLIIGTHAIFSLDFKNLGLLIIDEEHKFGVKDKSKLSNKYPNIHLLSMSATPIPRTFQQSIAQLKLVSTLETPPKERVGVKTFLKEYDDSVVKGAILKELKRNGQIFYIFNSIAEIEKKEIELKRLLPYLKVVTLHSKVSSKFLESEMVKFEAGEYDLLLSTSIVSSGIHIPNVNTILIDGADMFGIADLHQLRGRVGRGEREGYCYYFIEDLEKLTENSSKRLEALVENSELGSGSTLARHDLEIRGGGNIGGESQSGHIDEVGYSLYFQMLEQEIQKLTLKDYHEESDVDIQLSVDAYISDKLIKEDRVRLDIYRRLGESKTLSDIDKIKNELVDRFGYLDQNSSQFLDIVRIRVLSKKLEILSVSNIGKDITLALSNERKIRLESPTRDDDDILLTVFEFLKKSI
jgi:transcription-repair coupling factor (superfamily II helicase)